MRRERGFSLIETTVAIALLAIIVVTILSAFSATTLATSRHRQQTALDLLTRSDAEYIKSQAYSTKPAAYSNLTASGYTFSYQVLYYDSTQVPVLSTSNIDNGLQELVLSVSGPNGSREVLYLLKVQP